MHTSELTGVVATHIAGVNALDTDAIMATFADDAYVNDARREFTGTDAIRRWVEKEMVGDKVQIEVRDVSTTTATRSSAGPTPATSTRRTCPTRSSCRLLQRPRRQDRQPGRDLQPARRVLSRTRGWR